MFVFSSKYDVKFLGFLELETAKSFIWAVIQRTDYNAMVGAGDGGRKERGKIKVGEDCHRSDKRCGGMNDLGWKGG